jgi:hypothetical protein
MTPQGGEERCSDGVAPARLRCQAAAAAVIREQGLHHAAREIGIESADLLSASIGEPVAENVRGLLDRALTPRGEQ